MRERLICLCFILFVFLFGIAIKIFWINTNNNEEKYINITVKGAVMNSGTDSCKYGISFAEVFRNCGRN